MDPLAALAVTSSLIQFVQFGSDLLSTSHKLYRSANGVLTSNIDVEIITDDLRSLAQSLKRKLPANRQPDTHAYKPSEDDEALSIMCTRCVEIADELIIRLEKVKLKRKRVGAAGGGREGHSGREEASASGKEEESGERRANMFIRRKKVVSFDNAEASERLEIRHFPRWDSFQKALETVWNRKEINELAATLRDFKCEIEFRILVSLRYDFVIWNGLCSFSKTNVNAGVVSMILPSNNPNFLINSHSLRGLFWIRL
jgi:hypothetical protein